MFNLPEYGTISSLARHGTATPPRSAWLRKAADRKADFRRANADVAAHRRNVDAGKVLVRLDADEVRRLLPLANRNGEPSGNFYRTMALPMRHGDSVQALVKPEDAKVWAAWMRLPGIDAFGPSLTQVEAAAGRKPGKGDAIALHINDFLATLATLEDEGAAALPDAGPAANFLRLKAHFERGVINIHVTPARAARLADVFAAAGIARTHVVALDRIAGRVEPRAF